VGLTSVRLKPKVGAYLNRAGPSPGPKTFIGGGAKIKQGKTQRGEPQGEDLIDADLHETYSNLANLNGANLVGAGPQ